MSGLGSARTLYELLAWHADATPDREAIVTETERHSFEAWRQRSVEIGAALMHEGIGRGDSVALMADNRAAWLQLAMGTALVGGRLVALNTWAKAWDLEYMIGHSRPRILVVVDRVGRQDNLATLGELLPELWERPAGRWRSERFPDLQKVVVIGGSPPPGAEDFAVWSRRGPDEVPTSCMARPEDISTVMFTSGSTSRPKAVPTTHGDLIENGFEIGRRQGLTAHDRVFLASPLFWAYGGSNAFMASLSHGAALVLQSQFRAPRALDLIERERCTSIYTLPAMTHALISDPTFSPQRTATLRTGLTIGPPSDVRAVAEVLGVHGICNIYGSSETYGNCCVTPTEAPLERRIHQQGPPLHGVELKIVDVETREQLPSGEVGEILVKGRITPGYLDESGVPVPVVDAEGFFLTGDLGQLDDAGWLSFEGRHSEMIKSAGINVSPTEVEDFLVMHPDVAEAGVVGLAHPVRGEQVVAFVRLVPGSSTTTEQLRDHCVERIAGYKVPAIVHEVESLPLTHTGKLARKDLTELATSLDRADR